MWTKVVAKKDPEICRVHCVLNAVILKFCPEQDNVLETEPHSNGMTQVFDKTSTMKPNRFKNFGVIILKRIKFRNM